MLVTEDGRLTGAISGGCLEGDALRKAQLVMSRRQPMLVTYDTTDEDDAKLGVGLGCEGIIHIMIEPIDVSNPANPIAMLKSALAQRQHAVLVTLFSLHDRKAAQPGTCLFQPEEGDMISNLQDDGLCPSIKADAKAVLSGGQSDIKNYVSGENNFTAFFELLKPAVSMIVVGAGNDVQPLVEMAGILGWQITVADGRSGFATAERFPLANRLLTVKPEKLLEKVTIDSQTVFVLMTHNYNYDLKVLRQLIGLPVSYTGMLGPRKKLERILSELQEEGALSTDKGLPPVHGPVGLDLGAETPEEIALSIIAEIKAVLAGRSGKPLKERESSIHQF